ncbi:MAG: ArsR/SmtB family transcription factor [Candidatus Bathyarchaeia archaeon]
MEGERSTSKPQMAVCIVDDPDKIRLLADFTRTEIIRLLSKYPMTETQLSEQLGLTKAAVGYHLHLLMDAGLIHIERVEAEKHGILQKYYSPIATLLIVDPDRIPDDVRRYFIQVQIEHLRGMFSVLQLYHHVTKISSKILEELAVAMLKQLKAVGQKHLKEEAEDAETLKVKVYAEALANLTKQREWHTLFEKSSVLH